MSSWNAEGADRQLGFSMQAGTSATIQFPLKNGGDFLFLEAEVEVEVNSQRHLNQGPGVSRGATSDIRCAEGYRFT